MLPALIACHELREGRLIEVLPHDGQPLVSMNAVYPSRKLLAPAVSVLVEFVQKKLRDEVLPFIHAASVARADAMRLQGVSQESAEVGVA